MPKTQVGTTYFNFIASHDGIGLRPAEGLLAQDEIDALVTTMQLFGGKISWREADGGIPKAYEINIALVDALSGTRRGKDDYTVERFLCAHAIMFGLEGLPGLYIHSLLGTENDNKRLAHTGHNRSINRHRWQYQNLQSAIASPDNQQFFIHKGIRVLLALRKQQKAFHPNGDQFPLHLGEHLFGFVRESLDRQQQVVCIHNVTDWQQDVSLCELSLQSDFTWYELISQQTIDDLSATVTLQPYEVIWLTNQH